MEKYEISEKMYVKDGSSWKLTNTNTDPETVYKNLCTALIAKKMHGAAYIKSIKDRTNFDGTRTETVYYDNGTKSVFTVSR